MQMLARRLSLIFGLFLIAQVSVAQQAIYKRIFSIKDQIDLSPVDSARVIVIDGKEKEVLGFTDHAGMFVYAGSIQENALIEVVHPSYHPLQLSIKDAKKQNFQLFLESTSFVLSDVVFTASKFQSKRDEVAQSITVLTQKEIELANPQTSADLLSHTGKIFVQKSQMGGGSPNLRGFEANKVLLVVDGVRMNNAIYRSGHLQNVITIAPELVARSEVLFGPGSVVYGSDALGGVMHFYTLRPKLSTTGKFETRTVLSSSFGSANNEKRIHAHIEGGGKKWAFLTSISLRDFDDLRVGSRRNGAFEGVGLRDSFVVRENGVDRIVANKNPDIQRFSAYSQADFLQKVVFIPNQYSNHNLNIQYSSSTNIPRYDRLTQLRNDRLRYAEWYYGPQERLMAAYHHHYTRPSVLWDELKLTAAYQQIQESRHSRLFQSDWLNHRMENLDIGSVNLDLFKKFGQRTQLTYGVEALTNEVRSSAESENLVERISVPLDTRYPDGGSRMNTLAAYGTLRQKLTDKLLLKAGLRWTYVGLDASITDTNFYSFSFQSIRQRNQAFSGSLEAVYQSGKFWELGWTAGTGFRAPNLDDVAKVFDSQPGNVIFPNENLRPEFTYNTDLSLRLNIKDILHLDMTGFATLYDQAIVVRDAEVDSILYEGVLSNVQINVNAQQAVLLGGSLGMVLNLGTITLNSSLNWTYGDLLEMNGRIHPLDHIPPLFGKSSIQWKNNHWLFILETAYQGWKRLDRFSPRDFNNIEFATAEGWPAWAILNFRVQAQLNKKIQLNAGIENLFDQHYRSYSSRISASGRNIYSAIRLNF